MRDGTFHFGPPWGFRAFGLFGGPMERSWGGPPPTGVRARAGTRMGTVKAQVGGCFALLYRIFGVFWSTFSPKMPKKILGAPRAKTGANWRAVLWPSA